MENNLKTILVTGGSGFIGSNFILYLLGRYAHYRVVNIDKLTYAADQDNLSAVESNPRYIFVEGDITNRGVVEQVFKQYKVEGVIHFAAESHVDNSISNPGQFIETNVNGTFILLDVARQNWMKGPFEYKDEFKNCRFHHISTDEVYGSLGVEGYFTEVTPYAPNSPYSASKASSDMIVRSYYHTYGLNVVTTNCSNNYGPRQHEEKLIPKIIKNALSLTQIPIYGSGDNVRDWLYVEDHCSGIDLVYHSGKSGETYNIGGRNERTNNYIVHKICEILDEIAVEYKQNKISSYKELITYVQDRPGHDLRYAIDASKLENELNWKANENFESGIEKTVRWFMESCK
ncbi:dTDP-glucose 4,6-dehydratase [Paenibacillus alvei TS-15]|uniref:dTDP-glucose 4,6-dehydratase n=1 Tax=Paenibacillus alvei TS-15 TaxID=1117108 RepID=S9SQ67_PAEAL|nr:dTDP-glucose 4,6-dehydratase [Paenibacillus alvei]EPY07902.1 dTDP-glucose 4,6-dehydratase [Paenibacillus alvei TS-15]